MTPGVTFCAHDFPPGRVGGPLTWLLRLLPELVRRGLKVRLLLQPVCAPEEGLLYQGLRGSGVDVVSHHIPNRLVERAEWFHARYWEDPTAVFVPNLSVAAYVAAAAIRRSGARTVGVLHSDDPFYEGIQESFGSGAFAVDRLVAVSAYLDAQVRIREGMTARSVVIPYGVAVPEARCTWRAGELRLAYAGRLVEEQKRIRAVTRALVACEQAVPACHARIFGSGPEEAAVRAILAESGSRRVVLAGSVSPLEMQAALLESQVFVLLSDYEGLPIALMEAMACGMVPVVRRMRSGIDQLVFPGETGFVVDRDEDVPAAIAALATDGALWQRLSDNARRTIVDSFSLTVGAEGWSRLVAELSAEAGPLRRAVEGRPLPLPKPHPKLAREDERIRHAVSFPRRVARALKRRVQSLLGR